ncbi:uncharacterized protein LOC141790140 [Halichoeres trimaculatus]|uniref:uncharacterized protein LOC141790140 n=1 Tax=Halichoeres trimaculatus TaxID=147232 RepID=UPI003D9E9436
MFPSSGLFADTACPSTKRGVCERPHCFYKHGVEMRCTRKSSIFSFSAVQNDNLFDVCGAPVGDVSNDDCLQQIERINKEIETVRHEVEQERRRLSHYQTAPSLSVSRSETEGKNANRSSSGLYSRTEAKENSSRTKKYVVDNSKPRTDLEYDPLSNFSADPRSFSTSGKEQKVKDERGLKRARNALCCNQKRANNYQASPHLLSDSQKSSELVIISSSPEKKKRKAAVDLDSDKSSSQEEIEINETIVLDSLPLELAKTGAAEKLQENIVFRSCNAEKSHKTGVNEKGAGEKISLSRDAEALDEKSPETPDQQDKNQSSLWKMNPLQPLDNQPKNSLLHKTLEAGLSLKNRQRTDQTQRADQPAPNTSRLPSLLPLGQISDTVIRRAHPPPKRHRVETASCSSQAQTELSPPVSAEHSCEKADAEAIIIIDSSSDEKDEFVFSEIELSDSDPMEECYRIFMEAKNEGREEQPDVSAGVIDGEKLDVNPQPLAGRKRIAHDAKNTEQSVVKSRPQPQVLVPLRGPAVSGLPSQPAIAVKIQQRASILTASVKGGQAFVASTCQRRQEMQSAPPSSSLTPNPGNLQPAPQQNAYVSCIPLETAVINVGNNLRFILPEGAVALPVTSTPSQVLTPVTRVLTTPISVTQTSNSPVLTPVQRYRTTAPVIIPAQARRRFSHSASVAALSAPAAPAPQAVVQSYTKPAPMKRKSKQQRDASKDKVPHDVRQRYVNMFTEEFLKTSANVHEAFEKALVEEKTVYNRSVNKLKYLSVAVNALKKLKNQNAAASKDQNKTNNQKLKGRIPLNLQETVGNDDAALYEILKDYLMTEEKLVENNYPLQHPEKRDCAVLYTEPKKGVKDPLKRLCCRCGATYSVNQAGKHVRTEECNYHYGKGVRNRVPGGVETRYSCCEGVMGAPGCQVFKLHVHDLLSLDGFVSTAEKNSSNRSCPGVYSLDCEMCYTIRGLELSRVTVVNSRLQVIYDAFVKPETEVIDFNTRFSGISEDDVKDTHTSLREVQATLLSFINADTILIGHSLETDLCALKLLHGTVVDTSVVFPHRLGPPNKLSLNKLTADHLRRIIQDSVCGHDTAEDAAACMELMLWRLKEDGKLKK